MKSAILGVVLVFAALALSTLDGDVLRAGVETGEIRGRVLASETNKPLPYANVMVVGTTLGAMSLSDGRYAIKGVPVGTYTVRAMIMGFETIDRTGVVVTADGAARVMFALKQKVVTSVQEILVVADKPWVETTMLQVKGRVSEEQLQDMPVADVLDAIGLKAGVVKTGDDMHVRGGRTGETARGGLEAHYGGATPCDPPNSAWRYRPAADREQYELTRENAFLGVVDNPLSTFSIDVDRASYGNVRRFVNANRLPPPGAVRIEELVNYFAYDYPDPEGAEPFAIHTELAGCPWNREHRLVRIALQGKRVDTEDLPPSNLVFLIDVSGSMQDPDKLALIKTALPLLVMQLRAVDRVAIVVYAGTAALWLDSTPGDRKRTILESIERLEAAGSTAGGAGITRAYEIAEENFVKSGNNRLILATDGDFNVGVTSDAALVQLIEEKRKGGVFLTVLGVGEGNLQDAKMEKLADHGNGNYAYLDDLLEAQKVLVSEMGGTLFTIAKDVKIQVEFNPARVKSYRLIGYENRLLAKEDFADDKKDAGELGAGHTVTALYEIETARDEHSSKETELRYVDVGIKPDAFTREEILTVRLRYKAPDGDESKLVERTALDRGASFANASVDFRFATAVAELGMILRDSKFKGTASYDDVIETAESALGMDPNGYRAEFVELAETCKAIAPQVSER